MITRNLTPTLEAALKRAPVVLLNGARQVGKSTLARSLVEEGLFDSYLTLDTAAVQVAAASDPEGFVVGAGERVVIDEVQLVPELFRAIKAEVDRNRAPGRFLLTGSADISVLPMASDALVGRMEVVTLQPFSQGELEGRREGFIDNVFSENPEWPQSNGIDRATLASRVARGGYPSAALMPPADASAWLVNYATTIVQRDVRDLHGIEGVAQMLALLPVLAGRSATLINLSEVSRTLGIPLTTLSRYVEHLQTAFLLGRVPAWSADPVRRMVKSSKTLVSDSGLAAALLGFDADRLAAEPVTLGRLLETFAANEIGRQLGWSRTRARMLHYRTAAGREVDLVLEQPSGEIVGIEVKASRSLGAEDLKGLKALKESVGTRFVRGVVLYSGPDIVPFGADLHAIPLDALWRTQPERLVVCAPYGC